MKVGDLVKFKHPDFNESYGVGVISGVWGDCWSTVVAYFVDEFICATEDELEVINESR